MTFRYVIGVKFDDAPYSKEYDFKYDKDDLKVGDMVVVDTVNGLQVAKVSTIIKLAVGESYDKAKKWVVQKIDLAEHNARLEREQKIADLKKQLEARRKMLEDIAIYEMLAKEDPKMSELLNMYKEVLNG
jgi:hypothetical protein